MLPSKAEVTYPKKVWMMQGEGKGLPECGSYNARRRRVFGKKERSENNGRLNQFRRKKSTQRNASSSQKSRTLRDHQKGEGEAK